MLVLPTVASADGGFGAGLRFGYETNPLSVSGDGPNGAFTELRLDGRFNRTWGSRTTFFADGDLRGRFYDTRTSDADRQSGEGRFGVAFARERTAVALGARVAFERETFLDRETGGVFEVPAFPDTVPPTTVAVSDRLDENVVGVFVKARWEQNDRLAYYLTGELDSSEYVEDYADNTELDSLDHTRISLLPGVGFQVTPTFRLGATLELERIDYDDRPALDKAGNEVDGRTREYTNVQLRLSARIDPRSPWSFRVGFSGGQRDDEYAGYYDRAIQEGFVAADRDLGNRSRVRLYAARRDVRYDTATVGGELEDPVRNSDVFYFLTRFEHRFRTVRWFVETGARRADNADPVFDHDRDWVMTGVQYRR